MWMASLASLAICFLSLSITLKWEMLAPLLDSLWMHTALVTWLLCSFTLFADICWMHQCKTDCKFLRKGPFVDYILFVWGVKDFVFRMQVNNYGVLVPLKTTCRLVWQEFLLHSLLRPGIQGTEIIHFFFFCFHTSFLVYDGIRSFPGSLMIQPGKLFLRSTQWK